MRVHVRVRVRVQDAGRRAEFAPDRHKRAGSPWFSTTHARNTKLGVQQRRQLRFSDHAKGSPLVTQELLAFAHLEVVDEKRFLAFSGVGGRGQGGV